MVEGIRLISPKTVICELIRRNVLWNQFGIQTLFFIILLIHAIYNLLFIFSLLFVYCCGLPDPNPSYVYFSQLLCLT